MSLSTVVNNSTDFYSEHYLESTFQKDLKEVKEKWKELGSRSPARRLGACAGDYFRTKEEALQIDLPEKRFSVNGSYEALPTWHGKLLAALGYELSPKLEEISGGRFYIPLLSEVSRNGRRWLVVTEAPFCIPESSLPDGNPLEEALELSPILPREIIASAEQKLFEDSWGKAIGKLFMEEDPPRWAMLFAGSTIYLFDREKYPSGRYLSFELEELFGRKEADSFLATAALLSKETLAPDADEEEVLHDTLEDNSHKFAYGVSDALQYSVRESIELIANEWVDYRRSKNLSYTKVEIDGEQREVTAEDLRHESLIYVYRLLFCFFAEARAELGILPMADDAYRLGYSLEALRDLEHVPLTEEGKSGFYFQAHLDRLFSLIHSGFHPEQKQGTQENIFQKATLKTFEIQPLTAALFDPRTTPLLTNAKLRNSCLQAVVRNLSLSRHEKTKTVGRVNYAELGINQLGAVYEGLLSYKGMFAKEDLIQVKNQNEDIRDKKTASWFVPKGREEDFRSDEIVRTEKSGLVRDYKKGSFILYLSGVDREKSASYYTPHVLTEALVREALRELLKDYTPEDADKILELNLCEPAMGSGAFLNEATSQLAEKYLELKQLQLGQQIDVGRFSEERLRVQHYIACRNVYGVDLNPTAVELGELSLWLGSIHQLRLEKETNGEVSSAYRLSATPWFGLRLRDGNSIMGSRRAVYKRDDLRNGKHTGKGSVIPRKLKPGEVRAEDEIYHFLVFDDQMVPAASEKEVKKFLPDESALVSEWLKTQVKAKYGEEHLNELSEVSVLIDKHFREYASERKIALKKTEVPASVWPAKPLEFENVPSLDEQEKIKRTLESSSGSFQRLKLLMDSWCALWFYPVKDAKELPSRETWLSTARMLLGGASSEAERAFLSMRLQIDVELLFEVTKQGIPDTESIVAILPWLGSLNNIGRSQRFFHWELHFPEILSEFAEQRGFDLVLGNPPWIKATWNDAVVLDEFEPALGVKKVKSGKYNTARSQLLKDPSKCASYLIKLTTSVGESKFLNSARLFAELQGSQTNLYKNFIVKTFGLLSHAGLGALLHPEGVYDESKGTRLRQAYYPRLVAHYQFRNQLMLFADIAHRTTFSINLFKGVDRQVEFRHLCNLFHPQSIEACFTSSKGKSTVPGIKTDEGKWDLRGHPNRVVTVGPAELKVFAKIFYGSDGKWKATPIPQVHSIEILQVLQKFISKETLADNNSSLVVTDFFHESGSQKDGKISRCDNPSYEPSKPNEVILTGPLFYVGNPCYQSARTVAKQKASFDETDLTALSEDFLPRTVYRPGDDDGNTELYYSALESIGKSSGLKTPLIDLPKFVYRKRIPIPNERSLAACLVPPGFCGVHTTMFLGSDAIDSLLEAGFPMLSLPFDFLTKVKGRVDYMKDEVLSQPRIDPSVLPLLINRGLRLSCLTRFYESVWSQAASNKISTDTFSNSRSILQSEFEHSWGKLDSNHWDWKTPLRTDFSRRQALIEIDVLTAIGLGITLKELVTIFRVQFPVLRQYELIDEYDSKGRLLPNTSRKAPGAKELRELRKYQDDESPIEASWKINNGTEEVRRTFYPPFLKVDREEDYRIAFEHFQERLGL